MKKVYYKNTKYKIGNLVYTTGDKEYKSFISCSYNGLGIVLNVEKPIPIMNHNCRNWSSIADYISIYYFSEKGIQTFAITSTYDKNTEILSD